MIAPTHPSFGGSDLPKGMRSVDDLSYFYLDLLDQLDLRDVTVVGVSLGAWIAAEIAIKSTARLSRLVMANAVGVKIADRETRDIVDIFALTEKEFLDIAYCDAAPARATTSRYPTPKCCGGAGARGHRAVCRNPYFHDPRLKSRCIASAFRHCSCGARTTACSARLTAAPIVRPSPARDSRRSRRPDIFPITSSRRPSPRRCWRSRTLLIQLTKENAMRVYHFTEQPYYPTWNDHSGSLRINLPNQKCDPQVAADLFHRYYDEWQLCDELGLDIMLNEHHPTATCMSSTVVVGLSVLARMTRNARLLVLGYPIGHRPDPLRCAEELPTIDVISRGRLDMGFIKGVPYEFPASNQNPVGVMDRFWEAHRLHHQGDDHARRTCSTGRASISTTARSMSGRGCSSSRIRRSGRRQARPPGALLGERGYVMATLGSGYNTRPLYDAYRRGYMAKRGKPPGPDRFAYLGLVAVAHDKDEARKRGDLIASYLRSSSIVHVPFRNPPGFLAAEDNARLLRGQTPPRSYTKDRRVVDMRSASVEELIDAGILFCGTPDQVYEQIVDFCDYCGGMGNLLMMGHAGFLTHEQTADNLTLFAREVYPRLKAWKQPDAEQVGAEAMAGAEKAAAAVTARAGDLVDAGIAAR